MKPRHFIIAKAKRGEFLALKNTAPAVARKVLPLFEIGRLTETMLAERKYLRESTAPKLTYLDRISDSIGDAWGDKLAMVDGYFLPPDMLTEQGDHAIAHVISRLEHNGMPVIPTIGYDRWENSIYQAGMKSLNFASRESYCLRLDSAAIEDSLEPEFFQETISNLLATFDMDAERCSVLIDFGDMGAKGISELIESSSHIIEQLQSFGFAGFITAGCSLPKSINLAVEERDADAMVIRKELILWKALRQEFPGVPITYGDYGVRGPTTNDEIRSKYINGKIRHTVDQNSFVVRGHPFLDDHNAQQMHQLASNVVNSPHYLGADFSWGDAQIFACSNGLITGSTTTWISIDTNHHIAYAVQEVEQFELSTVLHEEDA